MLIAKAFPTTKGNSRLTKRKAANQQKPRWMLKHCIHESNNLFCSPILGPTLMNVLRFVAQFHGGLQISRQTWVGLECQGSKHSKIVLQV